MSNVELPLLAGIVLVVIGVGAAIVLARRRSTAAEEE